MEFWEFWGRIGLTGGTETVFPEPPGPLGESPLHHQILAWSNSITFSPKSRQFFSSSIPCSFFLSLSFLFLCPHFIPPPLPSFPILPFVFFFVYFFLFFLSWVLSSSPSRSRPLPSPSTSPSFLSLSVFPCLSFLLIASFLSLSVSFSSLSSSYSFPSFHLSSLSLIKFNKLK